MLSAISWGCWQLQIINKITCLILKSLSENVFLVKIEDFILFTVYVYKTKSKLLRLIYLFFSHINSVPDLNESY